MNERVWNGKAESQIRKTIAGMAVGISLLAGTAMTLQAKTPESLWDYNMTVDEDGNTVYEFEEVEMTLPAEWNGKYGMENGYNPKTQNGYITVYHVASRKASSEQMGTESELGSLFTLTCSTNDAFQDTLPDYKVIGNGDGCIYYVIYPTDVQGYTDDPKIWKEWQTLYNKVDWVTDRIVLSGAGNQTEESGTRMEATAAVNIRSKASAGSAVMGVVLQGYHVTVTGGEVDGWMPISYEGIRGYIWKEYLTEAVGSGQQSSSSQQQSGQQPSSGQQQSGQQSLSGETEETGSTSDTQEQEWTSMVLGEVISVDDHEIFIKESDGSTSILYMDLIDRSAYGDRLVEGAKVHLASNDAFQVVNMTIY